MHILACLRRTDKKLFHQEQVLPLEMPVSDNHVEQWPQSTKQTTYARNSVENSAHLPYVSVLVIGKLIRDSFQ